MQAAFTTVALGLELPPTCQCQVALDTCSDCICGAQLRVRLRSELWVHQHLASLDGLQLPGDTDLDATLLSRVRYRNALDVPYPTELPTLLFLFPASPIDEGE